MSLVTIQGKKGEEMKHAHKVQYSILAVLAASGFASALTQQCSGNAVNENGNFFCGSVRQILYENIVGGGVFKDVIDMGADGSCQMQDKPYSGPLAPFDEDLSVHVRGPFHLKEMAVYNPAQGLNRRRGWTTSDMSRLPAAGRDDDDLQVITNQNHERRGWEWMNFFRLPRAFTDKDDPAEGKQHGKRQTWRIPNFLRLRRSHQDDQGHQAGKRQEWVTATINGKEVSWPNNYLGPSTTAATASPAISTRPKPTTGPTVIKSSKPSPASQVQKPGQGQAPQPIKQAVVKAPSSQNPPSAGDKGWQRAAYYNAESHVADNVMFMANYGGQGSGRWDNIWGNSLSYLNASGTGGASSAQTLNDVQIPSNKEFAIFSAQKCDANCGYSRAPEIAYQGFPGANKVFLFHFSMPRDGDGGFNGDMPALWVLSGRIPRAAQYDSCSCWNTGCGEFDIFEVLAPGDVKCKSTIHLANGGGSSDYFDRPVDGFIKVAVVFDESKASVSIKVLPDSVDFSETLDAQAVQSWLTDGDGTGSVFQISQ